MSETDHNDADVAFATDMIQHHAQALSMVDLTEGRTLDPEVKQLAEDIRATQAPEIEKMADWLQDWDEKVPATMRDHSNALTTWTGGRLHGRHGLSTDARHDVGRGLRGAR